MKYGILGLLFLISACAKSPGDGTQAKTNLYYSESHYLGSNEFVCYGCLVMESQDFRNFRITWTESENQEECINKGTSYYTAPTVAVFPDASTPNVTWDLNHLNSNHDATCFPQNLQIQLEYVGPDEYKIDYNSKLYRIKKL